MTYIYLVCYSKPRAPAAAETNVTTSSVTNTYTHVQTHMYWRLDGSNKDVYVVFAAIRAKWE